MKKMLIVCLVAVLAVGFAASAEAAKKVAGTNFWDKSAGAGVWNAAVLDGTKLFLGGGITFNGQFGSAFAISAINQTNGNYLWNIPATAPVYRGGGVFTADGDGALADTCLGVATFGNKVYGVGQISSALAGSAFTVLALNQTSGNVAWGYLEDFDSNFNLFCASQADQANAVATGFDFFGFPWVIAAGFTTTNCPATGLGNLGSQFSVRAFDPPGFFFPLFDDFNFVGAAAGALDRANVIAHDNFSGVTFVGGVCTQVAANGGVQACVRAYDLSFGLSPIPAPLGWLGGFSDPVACPACDAGATAALTATAEADGVCATCNAEVLSMTLGIDYSFGVAIPAIFAVGYAERIDPITLVKDEQLMVWAIDQFFGFTLWTYFFNLQDWLVGVPLPLQDRALSVTFRDPVVYVGGFGLSDFFAGGQGGVVIALDTQLFFAPPIPLVDELWIRTFNRQADLADQITSVHVQAGGAIVAAGGFQNTTQPGFAGPGAFFSVFGLDANTGLNRFKPATTQRRAGTVNVVKVRGNTIWAVGANGANSAARAYWMR